MSEPAHSVSPMVLAELPALEHLPVDALLALRRQLRVLAADIEREVTARLVAQFRGDGATGIGVLTTARLAELWEMPAAKIRELCRTGRIPARKLGDKEWVVPVDALREWAKQGIVDVAAPRHNPGHADHRGAVARPRPHAVEIRRPGPPNVPTERA